MNSPVKIIKHMLPQDVLDIVQSYLVNDIAYTAISSYFDRLYIKKNKYEEFVWSNYVYPKCYCNNCPDNGKYKIYKKNDCNHCFIFEYTTRYMPNDFNECILNNPQFQKIYYDEKKSNEYSDDSEDYYECSQEYYEYSD